MNLQPNDPGSWIILLLAVIGGMLFGIGISEVPVRIARMIRDSVIGHLRKKIKALNEENQRLMEGLLTYWGQTEEAREIASIHNTLQEIGNKPRQLPETEYHGEGQQEVR